MAPSFQSARQTISDGADHVDPANPDNFPVNTFTGQEQTLDQTFSGKTIFDVSVSYRIVKGVTLTVGGNNIFDTYQDIHAHSGNMSAGRFVYSRRVQQFGFNTICPILRHIPVLAVADPNRVTPEV